MYQCTSIMSHVYTVGVTVLLKVRKDRGCQREIESIEVDCPTQPEPCTWRGKLTDMEVYTYIYIMNVIVYLQQSVKHTSTHIHSDYTVTLCHCKPL